MPTGRSLVFHDELISSKDHPLLLDPPYKLTLSISELTTPKELKENRNRANETEDNIPRPHNAFILFRSDYAAKMKHNNNEQRISIRVISQMSSKQWKREPEQVKLFFKVLADLYQEHHKALYPHYKYTPKAKSSPPYNVKKNKLTSKQDALKKKKKECMITWYVHDNIEDEDRRSEDNSKNSVVSNDPSQQDSQTSIPRIDSQQIPATFINYTASPSSSSLTFHSTTTTSTSSSSSSSTSTSTSSSSYDRFAVNDDNSSSPLSPPPSPLQPENLLYWTDTELPNNDNLLSLLDFDNGQFFFN